MPCKARSSRGGRDDEPAADTLLLDGRYKVGLHRAEPALHALLGLRHEITTYIDRSGDIVTLHHTEQAGSGFSFLLRAWVSLYDGEPVDLRGVQTLDSVSMAAFEAMMRAYWQG